MTRKINKEKPNRHLYAGLRKGDIVYVTFPHRHDNSRDGEYEIVSVYQRYGRAGLKSPPILPFITAIQKRIKFVRHFDASFIQRVIERQSGRVPHHQMDMKPHSIYSHRQGSSWIDCHPGIILRRALDVLSYQGFGSPGDSINEQEMTARMVTTGPIKKGSGEYFLLFKGDKKRVIRWVRQNYNRFLVRASDRDESETGFHEEMARQYFDDLESSWGMEEENGL